MHKTLTTLLEQAAKHSCDRDVHKMRACLDLAERAAQDGADRVYCAASVAQCYIKMLPSGNLDAYRIIRACEFRSLEPANSLRCVEELWSCAQIYATLFGPVAIPDIRRCLLAAEERVRTDSYGLSITARIWLESFGFNSDSIVEAQRLQSLAASVASEQGDLEFNKETADMIMAALKGEPL